MSEEKKPLTEEQEAPQTAAKNIAEKPAETKPAPLTDDDEVVIKLEDFQEEEEYPEDEMNMLSSLYDRTMNTITEGTIVTGRILDITAKDVIVDIGFKSEGIVPKEEFKNPDEIKIGDEVEVFLESLEGKDGELLLSRRRADFLRVWERVVSKYENDEIVEGVINRRIKGGMVVNLMGIDAFLPGSQIDVKPIRDFDAFLGRTREFKIVKVNHARKNIVVSSRVLIEKEVAGKREEILSTLEKGQVRKGTVKNITDFGVFIDLGGVDGLLHITDLSWGRVNHPSELVKLDQELEVMILDYNEQKNRISLGLKQLQPHPWENVKEKYPIGQRIKGKVVSITDYGAFIELEKGIEGLIHISEMSWSQHVKHPSQLLSVGQEIDAVILNIEAEAKKISLGLKQLEPDPWEKVEERFPVGTTHRGTVRNLTQFGAFVELEEGVDGLVHISDLSWTKKVRHPSEIVKKGDEIDVVVLGINREERRIALGHKQVEDNPWETFEEKYAEGSETEGTVAKIIEKGVVVILPLGVEGFIPNQHLGLPKGQSAKDVYKEGDTIPAKVIEFDKENHRIVLSVSAYFKGKEKAEWEEYMSSHGVEKTTLEEVARTSSSADASEEKAAEADEEEKKTL
ncbi:MAG TPA: 30S ribosomal protein S1 [Caldithrix abyssi]|uniref:Small ribosomal subunit protein bS1 n=1 Tax=Caldithrix abyssi TaxID=187145 RepID=A0A7V1LP86_CALAY|nr:30S ribosomal protein S1 [Caldithrix abyssi]